MAWQTFIHYYQIFHFFFYVRNIFSTVDLIQVTERYIPAELPNGITGAVTNPGTTKDPGPRRQSEVVLKLIRHWCLTLP